MAKVNRNKFGVPVGIIVEPDDGQKLSRLRAMDSENKLSDSDIKTTVKYFTKKYPDDHPAVQVAAANQASQKTQGIEDLLGDKADESTDEPADSSDGPSVSEMRATLKEAGVAVSPNAKDATVLKKYEAYLDSLEA